MKLIGIIILILTAAFGAWFFIDGRKADCKDVKKLEETIRKVNDRLDFQITSDQLDRTQDKIDKLKNDYKGRQIDDVGKERLDELKKKEEKLDRQMKILEKKALEK